ncbi:conserved hypothetical protein [Methanococcus vannielii SB]|uniref:DUF3784 domain-containing protein n=1 Tax=Methanococcus vannielii (strain ATCC 35089 / DSM 1224 / JCM 13029 / OCM 148 / SB) TaxID=406327 RepID=A6UNJ9_METVS|nr:DUF3784 domain-containing protein [Methanococcus vannielii]ABR54071.1 conserved hypothetical protein [Methanococcus vannielii SB]
MEFIFEIIFFINALILAALGFAIRIKKASFLISGYNTSSKEEKAKYDEVKLCNFVGNLLFVLSGILFSIGIFKLINIAYFRHILDFGMILFVIVIMASLIYLNTGKRFKKLK